MANEKAYGLLINYEFCTGCHSCEVSCQMEHDLPVDRWGIKIQKVGPWQIEGDRYQYDFVPVPTDQCNLCAERTDAGREPICVHHCLANVLYYGTVEDLSKKLADKPKQMLIVPQYLPREARGAFVHVEKGAEHKAAHIEVSGTGSATFGAHRHDAKVGEFEEDAV